MTPFLCPHCGAVDVPSLSPGPGPHVLRATYRHCGHVIKLVPRALVRGAAGVRHGDTRPTIRRRLGKETGRIFWLFR
jgi:hypothetical protein